MVTVETIAAFEDNYIWLVHDPAQPQAGALLVDPGDARPALHALRELDLSLRAVLITHHHGDHVGGIRELRGHYPDVPVYGPQDEFIPHRTHALRGGESLELIPGLTLQILAVPGHTRGHIAYLGPGMLFCGDLLFTAGCGKVFDGTVEDLYRSLQRISALPDDTKVYCAHEYTLENLRFVLQVEPGNPDVHARLREARQRRERGMPTVPSTLAEEKRTNPFLRTHVSEVKTAAERYRARPLATQEEVFIALREWRG